WPEIRRLLASHKSPDRRTSNGLSSQQDPRRAFRSGRAGEIPPWTRPPLPSSPSLPDGPDPSCPEWPCLDPLLPCQQSAVPGLEARSPLCPPPCLSPCLSPHPL